MNEQRNTAPRVCVLTQTASNVPPHYREFFAGLDLYFVTFKQKNPDAVDFLPGSTWSDGRNRLWEHVRGKYDYYLFIDDDLEFFCLPTSLPTSIERLLQKKKRLQERLHLRRFITPLLRLFSYEKAESDRFRRLLFRALEVFRPMVASVTLTMDARTAFHSMDQYALHRSRRVRPLGWFDAQVTIFSELGASLLLPYDTSISGWWSSQIPIYVLAHLAFGARSLNILDLASHNTNNSLYRPGYDGFRDCLDMSAWLSPGILTPECDPINLPDGSFIDQNFASRFSKTKVRRAGPDDETLEDTLARLGRVFDLHHPYLYSRHRELIDVLDASAAPRPQERVHG